MIVFDKKDLVTTLGQSDFALTVDGKPQTLRYFDHDTDVPLTVGLLVDVSRSQTAILGEEQKASQTFLDSFLKPAGAKRAADKAFVLQFAHTAELLQDVTESHPLLAAGLKQIGTQAPGGAEEEDSTQTADRSGSTPTPGNQNPNGGGYGGYGRRSGTPNGGGYPNPGGGVDSARRGTVLYDAVYLASDDIMARQKGRRALVLLTDGVDRHSKESLKEAVEAAQRADTVVYAIYYKGQESRNFNNNRGYDGYPGGGGGYPGYGGGYPGYGRPNYPGSGGTPGSDGTYATPDGKKILERICGETGGRMFEVKGKGSLAEIYSQIGDELRAQYRLGFTPTLEASGPGYHPVQLTLTNPANKRLELQTREGYYTGAAKPR